MASILARQTFRTVRQARLNSAVPVARTIHSTPSALKKKGKIVIDDLFSDDAFQQEELVEAEVAEPESSKKPIAAESTKPSTPLHRKKLDPAVRQSKFEEQLKYIEARVGRDPSVKERVRKRHFLYLVDLATSEKELRRVVELVPKFKEAGGVLIDTFAEDFTRRCQELQCQRLALEVFGNYAKYDIWLDIKAARWLLHSLYVNYPLNKLRVALALYPVYNLPPFSEDLASASLVAAACYKTGTPEALKTAEALRPQITALLEKVKLDTAPDHATRKHNKWVSWALQKINRARKNQEPYVPWKQIPLKIQLQPSHLPKTPEAALLQPTA